jgi:hypothetical protein
MYWPGFREAIDVTPRKASLKLYRATVTASNEPKLPNDRAGRPGRSIEKLLLPHQGWPRLIMSKATTGNLLNDYAEQ